MASLTKHPKSKFWSACFKQANGKPTTRSTKLTDRKAAQALADLWETPAKTLVPRIQAQRVYAQMHEMAGGDALSSGTIRQYLTNWVSGKKPEISAISALKYVATVSEFLLFLGSRADDDLLRITVDNLVSFRDSIAKRSSVKTANNKLTIVKQALLTAWEQGKIPDNIAARVKKLSASGAGAPQKREPFTQDQLRAIFKKTTGEWKGMVLFAYFTGARLSDIAKLKWNNIEKNADGELTVSFVASKTQREMKTPLTPSVVEWLDSTKGERSPLSPIFPAAFQTLTKNRNMSAALSKQFRTILVELGFADKRERLSHGKGRNTRRIISPLSFHSFRHTLTSHLHRQGSGMAVVLDIVGHSSQVVNQLYTHIDDPAKRRVLNELDVRVKKQKPAGK